MKLNLTLEKDYLIKLAERVVSTFGTVMASTYFASATGIGGTRVLDTSAAQRAAVAGVGAVVMLLYGLVAKLTGNNNSPALLPKSVDK